jgi:NitT/TauT family transport system substrate-binding protein
MTKKNIIFLTVITVFVTLVFSATGCGLKEERLSKSYKEKPILKIGYLPITHSLSVVIADRLNTGKYQNLKLELVKFSSWPELADAFSSGRIQGASELLVLAMAGAQKGIPGELIALSHRSGDAVIVAKDINSVKELKGKTVAIPHRMSAHNILLYRLLAKNSMRINDVERIEMPPPDMPAALARGDIKSFIVAEPFGAMAVQGGYGKLLVKARDIWPDYICCGLVLNPEFKKNYPAATREFVYSLADAGQFIEQNRNQSIKIAQDYMNIEAGIWEKSFDYGVSYTDLSPKREELEILQSYMMELKLLNGPINLTGFLNDSFINQAYGRVK